MKISVIVAVYNGADTIKATIESILNQTHQELELLIVDDGSTDDSFEIMKTYRDERVKVFSQKNSGSPAGPRNLGVKKATGEFIALCDQDDLWYPDKTEKQIAAYVKTENKDDVGIIISSADLIDEKGEMLGKNQITFKGFLDAKTAQQKLLESNFITTCSAIIPRRVMDEIGGFDENLRGVDDFDLWLRTTEKYGVLGVPETLCAWRKGTNNLSGSKTNLYLEDEKIYSKYEQRKDFEAGHAKNMARVLTAAILEKRRDVFRELYPKLNKLPVSNKAKILFRVYNCSQMLGYFLAKVLKALGVIKIEAV